MIDIKTGDIVLVESAAFLDAYGFCRVHGEPTDKTVMLQGMDWSVGEWSPKAKRRDRSAVRYILPQDADINAMRVRMAERRKIMMKEQEEARQRFHDAVKMMVEVACKA